MRALGWAGIATWAVLTLGYLASPGTALAQRRGGGLVQGIMSNALEMTPGFGGRRGGGEMPTMYPYASGGGVERQGWGRRFEPAYDASNGLRQSSYNPNQPYLNPGSTSNGPYPNQLLSNPGQPYQAVDGNWYYPDGRPYSTATAQPAASPGRPYQAVDGNWYYPDGRPYSTAATTARRPTTPATTPTVSATPTTPTPTVPATPTPEANVIPDLERSAAVVNNIVRTRLPAASSSIREELAQELLRSHEEGIDRLESNLRAALFSEADEAAFLAIYKRSFTEDTPQFRLARKNIKYLDADELLQGLIIDGIVDAGAQVYPAKLEVSAKFGTFKREVLGGRSSAEFDRAAKGLLKTYERIARSPEFNDLSVPDLDQVRAEVSQLRHIFEVRQRLAEARETAAGKMVTMDKRFRIVSYPGLPKEIVQAIDPQVCLWGSGTGTIEVRDAELLDLGIPLLNREASPVAETPRPPSPSGSFIYNPKSSPIAVHYVTDGVSYELKPGESRAHEVNANSRITYNRGGTLGNITYQLTAGTYRFSIQDRAWQVTKPTFSVIIDNLANGCDFQCNVDGQPRVIPARETLQLTSNYPISIRFDREEGQGTSCKLIGETPRVTVGVAPGSSALDLFPGSSKELCIRPMASESIASLTQPGSATPAKVGRQPVLPTVEDLR